MLVNGSIFFPRLKLACWMLEQNLRATAGQTGFESLGTGRNWRMLRIASDYRLGQRSILCAGNKKVFTAATPPLFPAPLAAWCELNNNLITKWIRSRSDVQPPAILKTRKLKLEFKNLLEKRSSKSNLAKKIPFHAQKSPPFITLGCYQFLRPYSFAGGSPLSGAQSGMSRCHEWLSCIPHHLTVSHTRAANEPSRRLQ